MGPPNNKGGVAGLSWRPTLKQPEGAPKVFGVLAERLIAPDCKSGSPKDTVVRIHHTPPNIGLKVFMDAHKPVTLEEGDRYPLGPPIYGIDDSFESRPT